MSFGRDDNSFSLPSPRPQALSNKSRALRVKCLSHKKLKALEGLRPFEITHVRGIANMGHPFWHAGIGPCEWLKAFEGLRPFKITHVRGIANMGHPSRLPGYCCCYLALAGASSVVQGAPYPQGTPLPLALLTLMAFATAPVVVLLAETVCALVCKSTPVPSNWIAAET